MDFRVIAMEIIRMTRNSIIATWFFRVKLYQSITRQKIHKT
jgi:hypothetical protein